MIATAEVIDLSRDDLEAVVAGNGAPFRLGVDLSEMVGAKRVTALVAEPGSLRRVDVWSGADLALVHGFAEAADAAVPATVVRGRGAAFVGIAQLVARRGDETGDPDLGDSLEVRDLLAAIVATRTDRPRAVVLGTGTGDGPSSRGVAVLQDGRTRWSPVGPGRPVELRDDGFAELWAEILRLAPNR